MASARATIVVGTIAALLLVSFGGASSAGEGAPKATPTEVRIVGLFADPGAAPADRWRPVEGATLATDGLQRSGVDARWESAPVGAGGAATVRDAFIAAGAQPPDAVVGLAETGVLVRVGPTIASSEQPTFAFSASLDAIRQAPSGGSNLFLVRPLDEQVFATMLEFACTDLRRRLGGGDVGLALDLPATDLGPRLEMLADQVLRRERCAVVATVGSGAGAEIDAGARAQAVIAANADVVVSANDAPAAAGLVNELRRQGSPTSVIGGPGLAAGVDAGLVEDLEDVWATRACVPELRKHRVAKRFVQRYTEAYGVPPDDDAAYAFDIVRFIARGVRAAGHDHQALNRWFRSNDHAGVCRYEADGANVLATSATVYGFRGPTDPAKVRATTLPLVGVPYRSLLDARFTPPTTAAPVP
jgi:ABC-type branched-subunit amino acid transport system substrate-binding protein